MQMWKMFWEFTDLPCVAQVLWSKFENWRQHAQQQKQFKTIADKALRRMKHLPLARAFYCFCDNFTEQKKLRRICNRIMHHWMHAGVAKAFDGWLQVISSFDRKWPCKNTNFIFKSIPVPTQSVSMCLSNN